MPCIISALPKMAGCAGDTQGQLRYQCAAHYCVVAGLRSGESLHTTISKFLWVLRVLFGLSIGYKCTGACAQSGDNAKD